MIVYLKTNKKLVQKIINKNENKEETKKAKERKSNNVHCNTNIETRTKKTKKIPMRFFATPCFAQNDGKFTMTTISSF